MIIIPFPGASHACSLEEMQSHASQYMPDLEAIDKDIIRPDLKDSLQKTDN